jgi:hypothetical protein
MAESILAMVQDEGRKAMQVTRMVSRLSFRALSLSAYALTFSALVGYTTFGYTLAMPDGSTDTGMQYVWALMGFIGSLLMLAKNRRIQDPTLRTRFTYADPAVVVGALVLIAVLPSFIGMVKGLILLLLLCTYGYWYFRQLQAQLWP